MEPWCISSRGFRATSCKASIVRETWCGAATFCPRPNSMDCFKIQQNSCVISNMQTTNTEIALGNASSGKGS